MVTSAAEYAQNTTTVDRNTSVGINHAIADAGHEWGKLAADQKTPERAAALALQSVKSEQPFLDNAGTKGLAQAYTQDLIDRSYALDAKSGQPKGTNLMAYLDDTSKAVSKINNYEVVENAVVTNNIAAMIANKPELDKFTGIKNDINASAKAHIGVADVDQDFLATVKNKPGLFGGVQVNDPKPQGQTPGWMALLGVLIAALTGGDIGAALQQLGGTQAQPEPQQTAPGVVAPPAPVVPPVPAQDTQVKAATIDAKNELVGSVIGVPGGMVGAVSNINWGDLGNFVKQMPKDTAPPANALPGNNITPTTISAAAPAKDKQNTV